MPFFVRQKVQISSKILPQIPKFAKINIFVTTASFRHFVSFSSKTILWSLSIVVLHVRVLQCQRPTIFRASDSSSDRHFMRVINFTCHATAERSLQRCGNDWRRIGNRGVAADWNHRSVSRTPVHARARVSVFQTRGQQPALARSLTTSLNCSWPGKTSSVCRVSPCTQHATYRFSLLARSSVFVELTDW